MRRHHVLVPLQSDAGRVRNVQQTDLVAGARVSSPRERACEVMLLMEGAMAPMLIHGNRRYIDAAARAAKRLVSQR